MSVVDATPTCRGVTPRFLEASPLLAGAGQTLYGAIPHAMACDGAAGFSLALDRLDGALADIDLASLAPPSLRRAARKRLLAWAGGRLCAERALARHGLHGHGVDIGAAGEPSWPAGLIGSITHTARAAYAVVAPVQHCPGIGIDSEPVVDAQAHADLAAVCFTAAENAACPPGERGALYATALFAAKEAFYKASYPCVRRFVGFEEAEATDWDPVAGTLVLRLAPSLAASQRAVAHVRVDREAVVHAAVVLDRALVQALRARAAA